jgi:8-oxo-dGTP pyrophosphatase MutT (NUDIX family)
VIEAAGILFIAPDDRALFLSRASSDPNAPGLWDFPGGKMEDMDKDLAAAAIRECKEETGRSIKAGDITPHTRRQREGVDFTTFLARVEQEFAPKLDAEHDGYAWAPVSKPPAPLHPGCAVALQRLTMDELGVARMIAAGELTSPQKYENVWLFDLRITGTGVAYRNSIDEFAVRPPEEYLNPEFLARCNGLPVIWKHPDSATLNSEEFANRIVGTVFLPYIGDGVRHPADDVWAVAKIHDEEAARRMQAEQLSTSPGVVLKKEDIKNKLETPDGSTVLFEGKPHLLDHVAICEVGVWDKGNAPTGVVTDGVGTMVDATARVDAEMTEEKKADAEAVTVDKLLKCVDDINKRLDAYDEEDKKRKDGQTAGPDFEKEGVSKLDDDDDDDRRSDRRKDARRKDDDDDRRGDARRHDRRRDDDDDDRRKDARRKDEDGMEGEARHGRGDTRRKDEDEEEEMEARRDRPRRKDDDDDRRRDSRRHDRRRDDDDDARRGDARADSVTLTKAQWDAMQRDMEALKSRLPKPLSDADYHEMHSIQAKADSVYGAFGANSRAPRPMEGETPPNYRRRLLEGLKKHSQMWKDIDLYVAINDSALPNVEMAIYNDAMVVARNPDLGEGELRAHNRVLESGHRVTEWRGKPSSWMNQFAGNRRVVGGIRTKSMQ